MVSMMIMVVNSRMLVVLLMCSSCVMVCLVSIELLVEKLMYIRYISMIGIIVLYMLNCMWFEIICGNLSCGFCVLCSVIIVLLMNWLSSSVISD